MCNPSQIFLCFLQPDLCRSASVHRLGLNCTLVQVIGSVCRVPPVVSGADAALARWALSCRFLDLFASQPVSTFCRTSVFLYCRGFLTSMMVAVL